MKTLVTLVLIRNNHSTEGFTMKVMVLVKATADSEAGGMPTEEILAAMGQFNLYHFFKPNFLSSQIRYIVHVN